MNQTTKQSFRIGETLLCFRISNVVLDLELNCLVKDETLGADRASTLSHFQVPIR